MPSRWLTDNANWVARALLRLRTPLQRKGLEWSTLLATCLCLFASCGGAGAPLDAETRIRIDSTANAQIAKATIQMDSLCNAQKITQLPHLIDSIKKVRLREIEEQLKNVPK